MLAQRFLSQPRNEIERDIGETHKTVLKGKLMPQDVADWWMDPSVCDIQGVDTKEAALLDLRKNQTTKEKVVGRNIAVMAKTQGERDRIRQYINDGFTTEEIKATSRNKPLLISVEPIRGSYGSYDPTSHTIKINPEATISASTTVHETLHHLRFTGGGRKNSITKSYITKGRVPTDNERTLEEAMNTAETTARMTPYSVANESYYSYIGGAKALNGDRKAFVGNAKSGGRGLTGKAAIVAVEKGFETSNISNLKTRSGTSAKEVLRRYK